MERYSKLEVTVKVIELVDFLTREMHAQSVDQWREIDMTIPQIKTMVLLQQKGPMRMGQIAEYLGSTLSATTSIVDRLVVKGFVDRDSDPGDRRVVVCKSTKEGQLATEQLWKIGKDRVAGLIEKMNVDELDAFVSTLQMLRSILEGASDDSVVHSTN